MLLPQVQHTYRVLEKLSLEEIIEEVNRLPDWKIFKIFSEDKGFKALLVREEVIKRII